jgi:phytanoyl-CoA hydroxylase
MSSRAKIGFEKRVEPHAAWLYQGEPSTTFIDGLASVDEKAAAQYDRDGFLLVRNAFSDSQIQRALDELRAMSEADDPDCAVVSFEAGLRDKLDAFGINPDILDSPEGEREGATSAHALARIPAAERAPLVRKFMGFTKTHPPLGAIANAPELRSAIERLVGERTRLFQTMALVKPPGGREKPWHQDHAYFDLPLDSKIVGVWIALGHVTRENGAMFMLPGLHRDGPVVHFMRRDWQICDTYLQDKHPVALEMEAGDLVLFDAKIPHGTPTNSTNEQRWALQFHYVPRSVEKVAEELRLSVFGAEGKNVSC